MNVNPLLKKCSFRNIFALPTLSAVTVVTVLLSLWTLCPGMASAAPKTKTSPPAARAAEPAKPQVAFLPFTVEISGSYGHLRQGLASMLASRLAFRADIAAVPQGSATEQMAKSLKAGEYGAFNQQLRQSGADYLVIGSLTPGKGSQFELTCYVFANTSGQTPKKFQRDVAAVADAMTAIDELAWDISGSVFGKPRPEEAAPGKTSAAFQTEHPERAWLEGKFAGTAKGLEAGGRFELAASYRSKNLLSEVMDINAGDVDGDGKDEIVVLTKSSLIIYRHVDGQFHMAATIDLPNYLRYLSVTLADLNNNGLQEIYISGSNGTNPDSTALEWNGKKLTYLFQHVPYYLRAMKVPHEPAVLLGQTHLASELGGSDISLMQFDQQQGHVNRDQKRGYINGIPESLRRFLP